MSKGLEEQKKAVSSGYWPLYRFDPTLAAQGKNPLQLDSKAPTTDFEDYAYGETRYMSLKKAKPEAAAVLMAQAKKDVVTKFKFLQQLAGLSCDCDSTEE
jgi:pyruvate-ferredoxin/flavodoxin oxidoreductase